MSVAIRNCLGVDIGSHSIRVASMEMGKTGPRVVALLEEPIKLDLSTAQTESQRQQQIARQLQEMLKKGKIRTKNAVFCIPGQSVFVKRPPKLPKTTPERLDRIIRFEARQQIPFPLDKTIMEYQVFEEEGSSELDVLLTAIKRDYIMNFMKLVQRTGLRPLAISVSSLALYNFHEMNTSARDLLAPPGAKKKKAEKPKDKEKEKGKGKDTVAGDKPAKKSFLGGLMKKKAKGADKPEAAAATATAVADEDAPLEEMGFEEVRAYVNLGASLMDLAIPKPGATRMIGFTRSVPLAGNEMDRAVREKLGLETADQARTVKETETAVLSTDFEIEGDAEAINMEASEAVTAIADRIISELRRSLDYYISQPDGVAVDSVVISGGLARLRYLRSYIEEKMGLPVELATARHQQLHMPDAAPDPFCPYVVATGLALQGLGLAQNTINFLPEEIKTLQSVRQKPYEMLGMGAMLLAIIGLNFNVGDNFISQFNKEKDVYNEQIKKCSGQTIKINEAIQRNNDIKGAYDKVKKAKGMRDFWLMFLEKMILEKRPADVLLDEVQLRLDGNLIIKARSPNQASIGAFRTSLAAKGTYFIKEKCEYAVTATEVSDPRFQQRVYSFVLAARTPIRRARVRTIGDQPTAPFKLPGMYPGAAGTYPGAAPGGYPGAAPGAYPGAQPGASPYR